MTIIQHGTLVLPDGLMQGDIAFENGVITRIAPAIEAGAGDAVCEAAGCLVFPGFIDAHTHLDMDSGTTVTADDFASGSRAAACGGTTTLVDFATQERGGTLTDALDAWHRKAEGKCACNYAFHMAVTDWNEQTRAELPQMFERGVTSFKAYYAYDNLRLDDAQMYDLLSALRPFGGVLGVHCENGTLVNRLQRQQLDRGVTGPAGHPASRPPVVEAEAIRRLCAVAKLADSPVHIVHLSSAEGLEEVRRARAAGQKVWAETCPQYLLLDESRYHLEGFEGAKYVMSPPLRSPADREALRTAVLGGEIDTISTDHCSYRFSDQKALGRDDFTRIPNGAPGIEHRPALIYTSFVASGLMTEAQMCRLLSENQAKLFGMWPRKGQLAKGADADITVWDPQARWVIRAEAQHQNVDYTPYEGFEAAGRARAVYVGGQLAAKDGEPSGASAGRYVKR
ncbi:MAG TPA: dihydropyrimidinase [Candidatus Limiplasma pullistercoris]|nr:dihydropyrimidinase [Candidatus Limiplasma pullistercoris]